MVIHPPAPQPTSICCSVMSFCSPSAKNMSQTSVKKLGLSSSSSSCVLSAHLFLVRKAGQDSTQDLDMCIRCTTAEFTEHIHFF